MRSVEERFWEKVDKGVADGCWNWTGALTSSGYGNFGINRVNFIAHRLSYEWLVGEIKENLDLDHLCRNRRCVNPNHLEPVTRRVNLLRGNTIPAEHSKKTHCPQGHAYTKENTYIYPKTNSRYCRICRAKYSNRSYHKKANGGGH